MSHRFVRGKYLWKTDKLSDWVFITLVWKHMMFVSLTTWRYMTVQTLLTTLCLEGKTIFSPSFMFRFYVISLSDEHVASTTDISICKVFAMESSILLQVFSHYDEWFLHTYVFIHKWTSIHVLASCSLLIIIHLHKLNRYCGSTVPPDLISSGPTMTVVFVTDEGVADSGFWASYQAISFSESE